MDDEHGLEVAIIWNLVVHKPWGAISQRLPQLVADFASDFGQDRLCDLLFTQKPRGLVFFIAEQACTDQSLLDLLAKCLRPLQATSRAQQLLDETFKSFCTNYSRMAVLRTLLEAGASPVSSFELLATHPMYLKSVLTFCCKKGQTNRWNAAELQVFAANCIRSANLTHVLRAVLRAVGPLTSYRIARAVNAPHHSFLGQLLLATHGAMWPDELHYLRSKFVAKQHKWDLLWRLKEGGPACGACAEAAVRLQPFPEVHKVAALFLVPFSQKSEHYPRACRERAAAFLQFRKLPLELSWLILSFAIDRSDV